MRRGILLHLSQTSTQRFNFEIFKGQGHCDVTNTLGHYRCGYTVIFALEVLETTFPFFTVFPASHSQYKSEDDTVSSTTRRSSSGSGQTYTPTQTPIPTPTPSRTNTSNSPSNNAAIKTGKSCWCTGKYIFHVKKKSIFWDKLQDCLGLHQSFNTVAE